MTKSKGYPSRSTRLVIYPIVGLLFVTVLTIIILLATGYKFTIENNHLSLKRTGMIIVTTRPTDAKIFMNGKDLKKTTFPFISTKINSLLPGTYFLEIKKNGYHTWQKSLRVYPDLVTWANYVLLFPLKNEPQKLDNLTGYKIDGANKTNRYYLVEKTDKTGKKLIQEYDSNNKEIKDIWPQNFTPVETWLANPDIVSADFSPDSRKILLGLKNGSATSYAILDTTGSRVFAVSTAPAVSFSKFYWNPNDNNELVGFSNGTLYIVAINATPNTATQIESSVVDFAVNDNQIYYVAKTSQNYSLDRIQTDGTHKTVMAESVLASTHYKFQYTSQSNALALLATDSGTLTVYYYLNGLFSSIKLGTGLSDMSWSKNGVRLNYFNENNIYCYDWEKQREMSSASNTKLIKMVWYYDNYHLFYQDDKGFGVVEFDGANKLSMAENTVASYVVNQSSFFYGKNENNIFDYYRLNVSF